MTETQTETVDGSGSLTGGSDTYTYGETGNDTSSPSDQGRALERRHSGSANLAASHSNMSCDEALQ